MSEKKELAEIRAILKKAQVGADEIRDTLDRWEAAGQPIAPKKSTKDKVRKVFGV